MSPEHATSAGGWRLAETDLVLVIDDDCVVGPKFVRGAEAAYAQAVRQDPRTGALTLPYYTRSWSYRNLVPQRQFGSLNLANGYFTTHFDGFPREYEHVTVGGDLLPAFRTAMVSGVCVLDRDLLGHVGGYADLAGWRSAYSDHLELAADLAAVGRHVWHIPDPRLAAIHLKYGAPGDYPQLSPEDGDQPVPGLAYTLGELVAMARQPRVDTGGRTAAAAALEEMIGLFFACYARRTVTGGRAFAVRSYRDYVTGGRSYTAAYAAPASRAVRRTSWRRGLERGQEHARRLSGDTVAGQVAAQLSAACAEVGEEPI